MIHTIAAAVGLTSTAIALQGTPPAAQVWLANFDDATAGSLPAGWRAESTKGVGPVASWQVVPDKTAPSGTQVLALSQINHDSKSTFNVCWTDQEKMGDGTLEVSFKAVSGATDQGGGPVWRLKDANNYYVCRFNPLEENFRVYVVKDGVRKQLGDADATAPAAEWHRIKVEHAGAKITCWLNDKKLLEATDTTLPDPGFVGVWTKADAVTWFDSLQVTPAAK